MGTPRFRRVDAAAYAALVGVSRATAYRDLERFLAQQSDPTVLRVVREPVRIGSGATRQRLVLLWPVARRPATAAPAAPANDNGR